MWLRSCSPAENSGSDASAVYCDARFAPLLINSDSSTDNQQRLIFFTMTNSIIQNARTFLELEKPAELCTLLQVPVALVERVMNTPTYHCYSIPKKRGGTREIVAPDAELKQIQRQLNYYLQACYLCIRPAQVHGFVINAGSRHQPCNIVANATAHVGKRYLLNLDLKEFFPRITARSVADLFRSSLFGFNSQISTALTLLTTFGGRLPTGAPSSPVISNFICYDLDHELIRFIESNNLCYSRYADDLTFSSNHPLRQSLSEEIGRLVTAHGFEVNHAKTRLTPHCRRQVVTGITVNEKVNADRKLLKRTRAMLHDLDKNGVEEATRRHFNVQGAVSDELTSTFISRLTGYINFIQQVRGAEDGVSRKFREQLTKNT